MNSYPKSKLLGELFLVASLLTFFTCSSSQDGALNLEDSLSQITSAGNYQTGILDSGHRVHRLGEDVQVKLDSLWIVSECFVENLKLIETQTGNVADWQLKISLRGQSSIQCPALGPDADSTLHIPLTQASVEQVILHNSQGMAVDSIYVRQGTFQDSSALLMLDSINWQAKKTQVMGTDPYFVRALRNTLDTTTWWRIIPQTCTQIRQNCQTVADTLTTDFRTGDTVNFYARLRCQKDSLTTSYCSNANWKSDSLHAMLFSKPDTLWTYGNFLVQSIPHCATVDQERVSYYGNVGVRLSVWKRMLIPSAPESNCAIPYAGENIAQTGLADWFIYDLDHKNPVYQTSLVDSILQIWMK